MNDPALVAHLDALSRRRALTDYESEALERAMGSMCAIVTEPEPQTPTTPEAMIRRERVKFIIACVAAEHGQSVDLLLSRSHPRALAPVRRELWRRLRNELNASIAQVARWTNRDHATVLYGLKAMGALA